MPRIGFKTENKTSTSGPQFAKLRLKAGERARVLVGLEEPQMEYIHTLRKPIIENGQAVIETDQKTGVKKIARDFVSRPLCTGDPDVLEKKGTDADNCVFCALAKENKDWAEAPEMRFAVNVFKYRTKNGSFEVTAPFSGEIVVWSFPASKFNKIIDIAEEFGDLRNHDLILGPCENENWQKFDINAAAKAVWRETDENTKFVVESFKTNKVDDLALACGQRKEARWVEKDIADIKEAWASIANVTAQSSPSGDTSLGMDLNALMESGGAKESAWATQEELDAELAAVSGTTEVWNAPEAAAPKAAAKAQPAAKPASAEPVAIEDLLAEVGGAPAEEEASDGMSDDEFDNLMADLTK